MNLHLYSQLAVALSFAFQQGLAKEHPHLQLAIQSATLVSVIIGFSALMNGINGARRQMNMQVLMKYTERYERILDQFPRDALFARSAVCTIATSEAQPERPEPITAQRPRHPSKYAFPSWAEVGVCSVAVQSSDPSCDTTAGIARAHLFTWQTTVAVS